MIRLLLIFFCCFVFAYTNISAQGFVTIKTPEGVEISENGKKVLFFQQKPKSLNGEYNRAGYIHPLYSLNENTLTQDFPDDHPYHRGIFWAWHQLVLNNKKIADGWISENISWRPLTLTIKKKKKYVTLHSQMLWECVLENNKPVAVIKEAANITVYKSTHRYRVLDFDIMLLPLVDSLKIGGSEDAKGYGGFCLRLKLPKDVSFISDNKEVIPQETAVTAGEWMNFSGSFESETSTKTGIVVFCSPSNPGIQQRWILRKEASMQNVPYPGNTPVVIPSEGLRLKYRIIIHNGEVGNDEIEKLYQKYFQGS
ncbi:MAG: PmoA family protein [Chitinophagaceae bacterium]|nr:PmoA family protein [Chitinophagaceae bacterium]